MSENEILSLQICECGERSVAEAISIFQQTDLPYKKAKKLVTKCDKSCCRHALMALFDMSYYGSFDLPEIARLIEVRNSKLNQLLEDLRN